MSVCVRNNRHENEKRRCSMQTESNYATIWNFRFYIIHNFHITYSAKSGHEEDEEVAIFPAFAQHITLQWYSQKHSRWHITYWNTLRKPNATHLYTRYVFVYV